MTGNVILIGLSIAGSDHVPLTGPLAALGGFAAGSSLLGLILRRFPPRGQTDTAPLSVFWVAASGMLAVTTTLFLLPTGEALIHAVTFIIGLLMGCQAIAARRVGYPTCRRW